MSDYEVFKIKYAMGLVTRLYDNKLITYDTYLRAREKLRNKLVDK
jgi:hypothetical protein